MACPYFCPTRRLAASAWRSRIRPPLGDAYEGECHARPDGLYKPAGALLLEGCNLGYAAGQCQRFPSGEGPEAVRFCVRGDSGKQVRIDYVVERAHLPYEQGRLTYVRETKTWNGLQAGSLLERQAHAYLDSYLAWKGEGQGQNAKVKTVVATGQR